MCSHPLHDVLHDANDVLRQAPELLSQPVSVDSLHCAVRSMRQISGQLAKIADSLADGAQRGDDRTVTEVVFDLRTMARHLNTGGLLLEPADEDLAEMALS